MKKVDGVDIAVAFKMASMETQEDRVRIVSNAIRSLQHDEWNLRVKLEKCEAEVVKVRGQLKAVEERLGKIQAGDWSALPDPKPEKGSGDKTAAE